jgi:hypothetical protein
MRHFRCLNRVACGILGRRHPRVLILLEQNDRVKLARTGFLGGFRLPCAIGRLLRVRLTEFALGLSHCASDADFRLR